MDVDIGRLLSKGCFGVGNIFRPCAGAGVQAHFPAYLASLPWSYLPHTNEAAPDSRLAIQNEESSKQELHTNYISRNDIEQQCHH